jgi:predicted ATPase
MGLHTGEGALGGDNYSGIDVNRAARVAGAASGGQVIVSDPTRVLVEHDLPDGVSLRDLGTHRLKDLNLPMRLHDLVVAGLPADFPAPRTLDARPGNLPAPLTSFVGREEETAEAVRLIGRARLLTLTGAGGSGKTRLAIHVGGRLRPGYRDGAFFADLSSVTDPDLVPPVLARAVGVPEAAGRPVLAALCDHLRDRELLLVADNFEQVVEAGAVLERLLGAAPGLRGLVTSRVVLGVAGEQELVVPPLDLPDLRRLPDPDALGHTEAVRLFVERAQAVRPAFRLTGDNAPAVAEICARLDGLPLAIELAATRIKVLTPTQILPRLERRLSLLTGGARTLPDRQRTLRGAIAWSHDLLPDPERRLFARLSVFAGGWTLESAEAVCDPGGLGLDVLDGLASLVDQSLVLGTGPAAGQARFSMLETIREFGQERLEATGDLEPVRRRHAEHFLELAVAAEPHLTGPDQGEWLDRCELEQANLRLALRWAADAGQAGRAQEAAGALWRFWQQRGHLAEGRLRLEELLGLPSGQGPTPARAEETVAAWRRTGDRFRLGDGLVWLGVVDARAGRPADARSAIGEARELAAEADSPMGMVSVLIALSYVARWEERHQDAVRLAGAADALREQVGGRAPLEFLAGFLGDPEAEARAHLSEEAARRAWEEGRRSGVDAALAWSAEAR